MPMSPHIVKLATEYLDDCIANNSEATLVGMHWYIDARNRTLPLKEEVNAALMQRPSLGVERLKGRVIFSVNGKQTVTNEDMRRADKKYRLEFARKLKR